MTRFMRFTRIAQPWRNPRSWLYLGLTLSYWAAARAFEPRLGIASRQPLSCLMRTFVGLPCPFCGLTTGSSWITRGDWIAAWHSNILSPVLMVGSLFLALYALVFRLAAGHAIELDLSRSGRNVLRMTLIMLLIAAWIVNLLRSRS